MRRALQFLAAALLAGQATLAAAGALDAGKVAAVKKAAEDFVKLAEPARKSGAAPRAADAPAKALLDAVLDTSALRAAEPLPFSELGKINDWNMAILQTGIVYLFAGTGITDITQAANDPAVGQKANQNTVAFAPEMGRYFDAQLEITRVMLETIGQHLRANPADRDKPNFKSGLRNVYGGAVQTFASAVSTLALDGLSDVWRRERLPAITALAPQIALIADAEQAQGTRDIAAAVVQGSGDDVVKEQVGGMVKLFTR
jgi:hypothetical protein